MKIEMNDLIVNYNVKKSGIAKAIFIMSHFDVMDKTLILDPHNSGTECFIPLVPDCYSHIISNPNFVGEG